MSPVCCDGWGLCDVTKYGALGDNKTVDTAALKRAIAACSAARCALSEVATDFGLYELS